MSRFIVVLLLTGVLPAASITQQDVSAVEAQLIAYRLTPSSFCLVYKKGGSPDI